MQQTLKDVQHLIAIPWTARIPLAVKKCVAKVSHPNLKTKNSKEKYPILHIINQVSLIFFKLKTTFKKFQTNREKLVNRGRPLGHGHFCINFVHL